MIKDQLCQLGKTLWAIADDLRDFINNYRFNPELFPAMDEVNT